MLACKQVHKPVPISLYLFDGGNQITGTTAPEEHTHKTPYFVKLYRRIAKPAKQTEKPYFNLSLYRQS
jgi:hypothetical protein